MFRRKVFSAGVLLIVLSVAGLASATTWNVYSIGESTASSISVATVGSQLVVAGSNSTNGAFVWTQTGGLVNLQAKLQAAYGDVSNSFATGINPSGPGHRILRRHQHQQ